MKLLASEPLFSRLRLGGSDRIHYVLFGKIDIIQLLGKIDNQKLHGKGYTFELLFPIFPRDSGIGFRSNRFGKHLISQIVSFEKNSNSLWRSIMAIPDQKFLDEFG